MRPLRCYQRNRPSPNRGLFEDWNICLEAGKRSTQRCLNKTAFASAGKNRWLPDRYCMFLLCGHKVSLANTISSKEKYSPAIIQPAKLFDAGPEHQFNNQLFGFKRLRARQALFPKC